jgi:hypothetical protein
MRLKRAHLLLTRHVHKRTMQAHLQACMQGILVGANELMAAR